MHSLVNQEKKHMLNNMYVNNVYLFVIMNNRLKNINNYVRKL